MYKNHECLEVLGVLKVQIPDIITYAIAIFLNSGCDKHQLCPVEVEWDTKVAAQTWENNELWKHFKSH